jgi:ribose/xylose/arabinose/galactoside ABC-type transport system permease subunit
VSGVPSDIALNAGTTERVPRRSRINWRVLLPGIALVLMLGAMFTLQPRSMSYTGLRLVLNYSLPLMFAAMAQLCVIAASDIDLGIGPFVGLVSCIAATFLMETPALGVLLLVACILAYAAMGAFIEARRLPSIVVTLGASFVWLGLSLLVLPTPGGAAPEWLAGIVAWKPPFVPLPIIAGVLLAAVGHWLFMRSSYGVVLRGIGSTPRAVERAGWSLLTARTVLYGLAGLFGVIAGLLLIGLTTSGDANVGASYTLLAIAAVIIGGAEFVGGVVSPVGAIIGTFIMMLTGSLLAFMRVSTDWQLSVQGGILILVLGTRALMRRAPR